MAQSAEALFPSLLLLLPVLLVEMGSAVPLSTDYANKKHITKNNILPPAKRRNCQIPARGSTYRYCSDSLLKKLDLKARPMGQQLKYGDKTDGTAVGVAEVTSLSQMDALQLPLTQS
jgi:hypothetical protein